MQPRVLLVTSALVLVAPEALAQTPTVVDGTLTWTATLTFAGAQSARFDRHVPTSMWVGRRGTSSDGLYRVGFRRGG